MINTEQIFTFQELFEKVLSDHPDSFHQLGSYDLLDCTGFSLKVLSIGARYLPVNFLSRHQTEKDLIEITTKVWADNDYRYDTITVTTDHVCMIYNKDHFFENLKAKDIFEGACVSVNVDGAEKIGTVVKIQNLGRTEEYVYDCEVQDGNHCFYGNDILVHNSQFLNISCVVDFFISKFHLPEKLREWPDEYKLKLWNFMEKFVEEVVNPFVHKLISENCFTEHSDVLRYSLEYIGDVGIYERKKRYAVHKVISEGPELVDKMKFTGIELKRSNVPATVKKFLSEIYLNTLLNDWTNDNYRNYIYDSYDEFCKLEPNEIAFWYGWSSDKIEASGFLQGGKGMTAQSKAAHFYNQMLQELKIGKKYDSLKLGDKMRFIYVKPLSKYNIDAIAFIDGQWPKEFDKLFEIDYRKMYDKLILEKLKSFRIATGFEDVAPGDKVLQDVFAL